MGIYLVLNTSSNNSDDILLQVFATQKSLLQLALKGSASFFGLQCVFIL